MGDAVIPKLYDATNAAMALGDEAGIARMLGPIVTTDIVLLPSESLLDSKPCNGVGEVVEWLATVSISGVRWKLETIEEESDGTFVARGTVEGQGESSGADGIATFEHRLTLRDGRIARLEASIASNVA